MVIIRKCTVCGTIFADTDGSQIFCSLPCQIKHDPIDEASSESTPGAVHNKNMLNKKWVSTGKCIKSKQSKYFYAGGILFQYR